MTSNFKVLIVVNNHNSWRLIELCEDLRDGAQAIEIHVACSADTETRKSSSFNDRGIKRLVFHAIDEAGALSAAARVGKKIEKADALASTLVQSTSLTRHLRNLLMQSSAVYFLREQMTLRRLRLQQERALAYFKAVGPDVVLSLSDRSHDYVEASTLWAARKTGVKIVLPYVATFDIDGALKYRKSSTGSLLPELSATWPPSLYKLISRLWLHKQIYKGAYFQAPYILNANRRAGTLSEYPWWVGNGLSDIVCVDSRHGAEQYARHGVNESKLAIVGHVAYDEVYASHCNREKVRQGLIDEFKLPPEKKILLLSVPQWAEQGFIDWDLHWTKIREIAAVIETAGQNCLLSIHPRSELDSYRFLEREFGFHIVCRPLAGVVGAADLFLASNSTTFAWAALCGIPSIALWSPVDFIFGHIKTIRRVDDIGDLCAAIDDCLKLPPTMFESDWKLLSKESVFDGRFRERFKRLVLSLVETRARQTALR